MMTTNTFRLDGKRALVTGSSAGIGLGLARGLAQAGASIVLNGRDSKKLSAAAAQLRSEGHTVDERGFDVTKAEAATQAINEIEKNIGAIDILINNAGIQRRNPLHNYVDSDWRDIMQTNLDSVYFVSKAVVQHMMARKAGRIINICSVQSELGRPGIAPYMATKGGLKMLTKGMAIDWGPFGINCNGIGPGYFKTELNEKLVNDETFSNWLTNRTPNRRWGEVHELAGAAVFLASDASSFVNGHVLYVDGGVTAQL